MPDGRAQRTRQNCPAKAEGSLLMKKSNRLLYYNQFDRYYRDHHSIQTESCVYCKRHATTIDHVPALSWICTGALQEDTKLFRVRACKECNGLLGGRPLHTVEARRNFLLDRYYQEFKKLHEFTSQDLEDLGPNLFSLRARSMLRRAELADTLRRWNV